MLNIVLLVVLSLIGELSARIFGKCDFRFYGVVAIAGTKSRLQTSWEFQTWLADTSTSNPHSAFIIPTEIESLSEGGALATHPTRTESGLYVYCTLVFCFLSFIE